MALHHECTFISPVMYYGYILMGNKQIGDDPDKQDRSRPRKARYAVGPGCCIEQRCAAIGITPVS